MLRVRDFVEAMKDILVERGIQPRLGPGTIEEAEEEVKELRHYFEGQP